jgi:hypothetical protein
MLCGRIHNLWLAPLSVGQFVTCPASNLVMNHRTSTCIHKVPPELHLNEASHVERGLRASIACRNFVKVQRRKSFLALEREDIIARSFCVLAIYGCKEGIFAVLEAW